MADVIAGHPHHHRTVVLQPVAVHDPAHEALSILRFAFTLAPVIAGIDKFFHFLVNWDQYLNVAIPQALRVSPHDFMLAVGAVEIVAGLLVAIVPRFGGWIVALWLVGIIANLLTLHAYYDIALRDFGLMLASIAMARLAHRPRVRLAARPASIVSA